MLSAVEVTGNFVWPIQLCWYWVCVLFITSVVILITLVFQGMPLPWLIQKVTFKGLPNAIPERQQELIVQQAITHTSLQFLEKAELSNEHLANLNERLTIDFRWLNQKLNKPDNTRAASIMTFQRTYLDLLQQQRSTLFEVNHKVKFDEDLIRKYLSLIDLEEFKVREKLVQENNAN